jgi:putative ABC transport system substrate-binding protein
VRRREFVTGLGGVAACGLPHTALAQQLGHIPRIAVLTPNSEDDKGISDLLAAFERTLRDLGWIEGRNVRIEYRSAGGDLERLRGLAKELVEVHPDVIVASNTPTVAAVLGATRTIPVVFGNVSDPVGDGFVQSYALPGGNATGFAYGGRFLVSKWLQLLKEISPAIVRVAVLFDPDAAPGGGEYYLRPFKDAAPSFAITPLAAPVRNPGEIEKVISGLEGQPSSGLIVTPDYFVAGHRELIISLAARHG